MRNCDDSEARSLYFSVYRDLFEHNARRRTHIYELTVCNSLLEFAGRSRPLEMKLEMVIMMFLSDRDRSSPPIWLRFCLTTRWVFKIVALAVLLSDSTHKTDGGQHSSFSLFSPFFASLDSVCLKQADLPQPADLARPLALLPIGCFRGHGERPQDILKLNLDVAHLSYGQVYSLRDGDDNSTFLW